MKKQQNQIEFLLTYPHRKLVDCMYRRRVKSNHHHNDVYTHNECSSVSIESQSDDRP